MTSAEAIERARQIAAAEGWTWLVPVQAHRVDRADAPGTYWQVTSNADGRGCNVRVTIDDATGATVSKSFAPR